MTSELPKARRVGNGASPAVYGLIGLVVVLLGVIVFLLMSGTLFDSQPTSDLERDYEALVRGLDSDPENPSVLMTLAEVEYQLGKTTEAIEHAEKAFELGQEQPGIPMRYAQIMLQEDEFEKARAGIDREVELDEQQSSAEPLFLLAQVQWAEGDQDAALETMAQALKVGYMAADMRLIYAEWLEEAGDTEAAEEQYRETLRFFQEGVERERALAGLERMGVDTSDIETPDPHDEPTDGQDQ